MTESSRSLRILLVSGVTSTPPMGLYSIAHQLDVAGHWVRLMHYTVEQTLNPDFQLGGYVAENRIDLVGIAIHWAHQSVQAVALAESVKKVVPSVFCVAGGLTASAYAGEIVHTIPAFDAIVRGEGEQPMCLLAAELVNARAENRGPNLAEIPNLVWRDPSVNQGANFVVSVDRPGYRRAVLDVLSDTGSNRALPAGIRANPMGWVGTGDRLASMRYARPDLLEHQDKVMALKIMGQLSPAPVFLLGASRGCPVECAFCGGGRASHAALGGRKKAEYRPVDGVLQDLRDAAAAGYRSFYVSHDPVPNGKFYFELFERMRTEGLGKKLVMGFGSWGLPNEAFLHAARETFDHVFLEISPESSNQEIRDKVRGFSFPTERLEAILEVADSLNIRVEVFFTYPLPGDTEETMRATRAYAVRLARRYSDNINMNLVSLSTDPQSPLVMSPELFGVTVQMRTFADLIAAQKTNREIYPVSGRKPWLQNHLHHSPTNMSERAIDIAGIASCTDQALWLGRPLLLHTLCDVLGGPEQFEHLLEKAAGRLLDELMEQRRQQGKLVISDREIGRRGIQRLCTLVEEELADGVPGLGDLAREVRLREELLSDRFAIAETQRRHSWLAWAMPNRKAPEPVNHGEWKPTARDSRRICLHEVPPYEADPRRGLEALSEAVGKPDRRQDVTVLLGVGNDPMDEWLLEVTPAVERAMTLVDGKTPVAALETLMAAEGFEQPDKVFADLAECAMIA